LNIQKWRRSREASENWKKIIKSYEGWTNSTVVMKVINGQFYSLTYVKTTEIWTHGNHSFKFLIGIVSWKKNLTDITIIAFMLLIVRPIFISSVRGFPIEISNSVKMHFTPFYEKKVYTEVSILSTIAITSASNEADMQQLMETGASLL